jgi:hypothetical protein
MLLPAAEDELLLESELELELELESELELLDEFELLELELGAPPPHVVWVTVKSPPRFVPQHE